MFAYLQAEHNWAYILACHSLAGHLSLPIGADVVHSTNFTLHDLGELFCIAGVLVGVSTALLYTATNSKSLQWFSSRPGLVNGLVKAGGGVGATVLPLAAKSALSTP